MSRLQRFGAAMLLACVAAGAAWQVYRSRLPRETPAMPIAARAGPGSDAASATDPPFTLVEIPARLPDFTLENRDGKPTSISAWRGKSLVLNFWATWCAPCRREIPVLQALDADWHARNIAVIGVAVDRRSEVLAFAQAFHINYPLLIGEQDALDAAIAVGVASPVFPFTVFTDRRGELVAVFVGELHRPQAELILGEVESLDDGHIALTAARRAIAEGLDELKGNSTS